MYQLEFSILNSFKGNQDFLLIQIFIENGIVDTLELTPQWKNESNRCAPFQLFYML